MDILSAEQAAERVDDLVHFDTQSAELGLDLTVSDVYRFEGPGHLDFGGSEFRDAQIEPIETELKHEDDDYGWWTLDPGTYLIQYNETVRPGDEELALVAPLERLERAGASHDSLWVDTSNEPLEVQMTVGSGGVHLKENFRASRLQIWSKHGELA